MEKESIVELEYIKHLEDENIKVVSFDIFETIAFRKVAKPIDIFKIVGNKKFVKKIFHNGDAFLNYRIAAEKNARVNKKNTQEVTLEEIYSYLPIDKETQKQIIELEIKEERNL